MVGIYFSGTGNTKHCIQTFLEDQPDVPIVSIEEPEVIDMIKQNQVLIFAYPIQFSNLPKIVSDFIHHNNLLFKGKKIFIITTMGLFSGDGTGCSARLFKKYGATIVGGLHVTMPDCIGDVKALKKTPLQNQEIILNADEQIQKSRQKLIANIPTKDGLSGFAHVAGLFGQRLWFYNKTKNYTDKLKVNSSKCIGCDICINLCPMNNLKIENNKAISKNKCTMCYRCVNNCPKQAITLLGKNIVTQYNFEGVSI